MKNMHKWRVAFSLLLVLCMLGQTFAMAADGSQKDTLTFEAVDDGEVTASLLEEPVETLAETEPVYEDTDMVRVSIVVEGNATIDEGYSTLAIAENDDAMTYRQQVLNNQTTVQSSIEQEIGERLDVEYNLALVTNMICANVEYGQIEEIKKVDGVENVFIDQIYYPAVVSEDSSAQPNMVFASETVNAQQAWDSGYTGAGTRIAIIDTGLDTDHQSFAEGGYLNALAANAHEEGVHISEYMPSLELLTKDEINGVLTRLNAFNRGGGDASKLYINKKIPFGFNYAANSYDVTHDNDGAGHHGSHVAGIAAANRFIKRSNGSGYDSALEKVMVAGTAPDAQIMVFKVFGNNGASGWDILAAVEDAIMLGADTINLSLGSVSPGFASNTMLETVFEKLKNTDTVAVISAGNNYDWAYLTKPGTVYADDVNTFTMGDPGSGTNSLSVASVENSGKIVSGSLTVGGLMVAYNETSALANNPNYTPIMGMDTSSDGKGTEYEYVCFEHNSYADSYDGYEDLVKGKFVLCSRGDNSFSDKANNAVEAGAIGVIIYNNVAGSINMDLSNFKYKVPCVSITKEAKEKFVDAGTEGTGEDGKTYYTGKLTIAKGRVKIPAVEGAAYEMSVFSSWGVTGDLTLKPEITAPGGYIYSVDGSSKTSTNKYTTMSGTSMAAPQVSGIGALVQQYIKDQGYRATDFANAARGLTQSILMSTAVPMKDANGNYFPVIQQGSGLANAVAATSADSYIKMNKKATASYDDGKVKAELGDDPEREGVYSFTFTITNLDGEERTYDLSADVFAQDSYLAAAKVGDEAGSTYQTYYMDRDTRALGADTTFTVGRNNVEAVTVPAGKSASVKVTIKLTEEGKNYLDTCFKNGSYVQAYVFATPQANSEGKIGTCHSIPVLAFYGNWTDSPMFYGVSTKEGQAYMNYSNDATTDNSRWPYFTWDDGWGGTVVLHNQATIYCDNGAYSLGGNPLVADDTYMPERNAVNSVVDHVVFQSWVSRNAYQYRFYIKDVDTNKFYSAYMVKYPHVGAYLNNTSSGMGSLGMTRYLESIPEEGALLEFGIEVLPEYYMDGKMGEDSEPGEGAYVRINAVVDDTHPEVSDMRFLAKDRKILVTAKDENYVSAVVLYNAAGDQVLTFDGAKKQIEAGEEAVYELDLSSIRGTDFFVQVFDYALNMSTFRIHIEDGEMSLHGTMLAFDQDTDKWVQIDKTVASLQSMCASETAYNAATSIGEVIFAVSDDNGLYATSVHALDDVRQVAQLDFAVTDLAYNALDEMLYGVTEENKLLKIDPETGSCETMGVLPIKTNTLACDTDGTFYCNKYGTGEIYAFTLDAVEQGISEHYDFNADNTVNALDSQLLLDYVIGAVREIENVDYADVDGDNDVDTYDVYKLQQMVGSYPKQLAVVNGIKSKYLQSMECDPNDGTLYWASYFMDMMSSDAGKEFGFAIFCEIDTMTGEVIQHNDYWHQLTGLVILDLNTSKTFPPSSGIKNLTLKKNAVVTQGEEIKLQAAVSPWNTIDNDVLWTSSDESIATVDANGVVTAVSNGVCKIIATSKDNNGISAVCTITVGTEKDAAAPTEVCAVAEVDNTQKNTYLTQQAKTVTVDLALTAVEKTTNGLQTVSFDSNLLELLNVSSEGLSGYIVSEELITIGYVSEEPVSRDGTLATLTFRVKDGGLSADLLIRELQRNNQHVDIETARNLESHTWSAWSQTTDPTCGKVGEETRTCSDCGDTETRTVPATGEHSWGAWEVTTPSDESTEGVRTRTCTTCGSTQTDSVHSTNAHVWTDWNVTTAATCGKDGEKVGICEDCGETLSVILYATGEHDWGSWTVNETDGTRSRACSGCDQIQTKVIVDGREGTAVSELFGFFSIGKNYVRDVQITGAEVVGVTLLDAEPEDGENSRLHYLIELSRSADTVDSVHAKFRVSEQSASGIGSAFVSSKRGSVSFETDVTDYDIDISTGTGSMTAWSYWSGSSCMAVHLEFFIGEDETECIGPSQCYGSDGYIEKLNVWGAEVEKATGFVTDADNNEATVYVWLDPSTPDDAVVGVQIIGAGNMKSLPEDWKLQGGYVQLVDGKAEISGIRYSTSNNFYTRTFRIMLQNHHDSMAPELLQGNSVLLQAEVGKLFKLDFRDYFGDGNGDTLTYFYSEDGGEVIDTTKTTYRYVPTSTASRTLTVTASDGGFTTEACTITIQPIEDHVWGPWVMTTIVTCTEDGEQMRTCMCCEETETSTVTCAGQHTWGNWENVIDAAGALTSKKMRGCHACGETELDDTGFIYGDVNSDGRVNLADVILMSRYLVQWEDLEIDLTAADVNVDGAVNFQDAVLLRRYLVGYDITLGSPA